MCVLRPTLRSPWPVSTRGLPAHSSSGGGGTFGAAGDWSSRVPAASCLAESEQEVSLEFAESHLPSLG